jgi:hypothetical protein
MGIFGIDFDALIRPFIAEPTQKDYMLVGEHASTATDLPDVTETEDAKAARIAAETKRNKCGVCGNPAQVQIFKGKGFCSENHRKLLEKYRTAMEKEAAERSEPHQCVEDCEHWKPEWSE